MHLKEEMLDFSNIDERISHLEKGQIVELIKGYYEDITISELKKKYQIKVANSYLIKLFPRRKTNDMCWYCEVKLVKDWESKSAILMNKPYCPKCKHIN